MSRGHQVDVTEADGVWTIKTSTTLKTMELKFKVKLLLAKPSKATKSAK
jgi:hypothetical protein